MLRYVRSTLDPGTASEQMTKIEDAIRHLLSPQGHYVEVDNNVVQRRPKIEMKHTRREKIEAHIISSLRYSQIDDRETSISEAYRETFQWMFKDSAPHHKDTKFREWLESPEPLYWITGKAGSGKSTLMKYISDFDSTSEGSLQCKEHLQKWAGGKDCLVVASFYLWASGSKIEASRKGLLKSLLFQILKIYPNLLPQVIPMTWEAWFSFGLETDIESEKSFDQILISAIQELVERRNKKVCLFVDGLDEYKDGHEKLIAIFRSFLLLPNVKMCVSSRPLLVFEDNFNTAPSLMLQEFTYPDIKHFVTSRFNENPGFARLKLRKPGYDEILMVNITDKASGVFLWVKLVVTSLLAGLTNDDRIADLQSRLDLLPPDLEKLYRAILDDLDPFYLGHASQYFRLLEASEGSLDALVFSFSDEESSDFALELPVRAITEAEIERRKDTVKRRLNSRCKGLLEVNSRDCVQFLHRSVTEYIDSSEVRDKINRTVKAGFDCHFQLCSANLAMVKIWDKAWKKPRDEPWDETSDRVWDKTSMHSRLTYAEKCLMMAAQVRRNVSGMIQLLDDLDQTTRGFLGSNIKEFHRTMPQESRRSSTENINAITDFYVGTSFLSVTVRFSIIDYVRVRAGPDCLARDGESRANDDVTTNPLNSKLGKPSRFKRLVQKSKVFNRSKSGKISVRSRGTWPLLLDVNVNVCESDSLAMFRCLFELGADPNLIHRDGASPWMETLAAVLICTTEYSTRRAPVGNRTWEQWVPILRLFIEYGAQVNDTVSKTSESIAFNWTSKYVLMPKDWLATALGCIAMGREDLGLEYLRGENCLAIFEKVKGKPQPLRRTRDS